MDQPFHLVYAGISDVGRVRKDNQDSGYVGPSLIAICDGVGGAARGDIASATAISQIRRIDVVEDDGVEPARAEDALALVAGALHRAHDKIGEVVEEEPALSGTSTTATIGLLTGNQLAIGHVGDSRAYQLHDGTLRQVTRDHTFVQTLIDDGRITEAEARTHPHRNLILQALDGSRELEPDLFLIDLSAGDRLLFCSDGVLSLSDARIADIMATGTVDYAAVELVRAALEAGSTDNVTALVAEVVDTEDQVPDDLEPQLVGAAAELPRRGSWGPMAGVGGLFRGHRSGDTGEIPAAAGDLPPDAAGAIATDPIDPEAIRYAPREPERFFWTKRLLIGAVVLGLGWVAAVAAWGWSQQQFYIGSSDGAVTIYRGMDYSLPGIELSHPYESSDVLLERLSAYEADRIRAGIRADSLEDARQKVQDLAATQRPPDVAATTASATPTPTPSETTAATTPTPSASPTGTATP